ncbi:hypothetical protein QCA50_002694 [Cerrena zonata]|uniref:Mini-chromosome maintenance complex-binding protein n=1 Tax=Cerrena zonata TaxID=2478898 RepID=A0AAW0GIG3_9APHY
MVSAYLVDALRDPTGELKELFSNTTSAPQAANFPLTVAAHFSRVFERSDAFRQIPPLDVAHPPESYADRSLVRFRAMVQDTSPSSEMYLAKYRDGTLGGWGIELESHRDEASDEDIEYDNLRECTVLWGVNVPGESAWSTIELDSPGSASSSASTPHQPARPHKGPISYKPHLGVKIKIYENNTTDRFKTTDVATFVGIISSEPFSTELGDQIEVPTLHVLFTAPEQNSSIIRPYPASKPEVHPSVNSQPFDTLKVREQLIDWIAEEALNGDREAAEWILLASIARVQSRHPPLIQPSLTLTQFPPPPIPSVTGSESSTASTALPPAYHPTLTHVLSEILPLTETLPLSLPYLNTVPFSPESKDEDLHAGVLQLPKGSVLLITEGGISEGKLQERGLMNVHALQELISSQTLAYKFPFSQFSFRTDNSCIVLSEGRKSAFLKTHLTVLFEPTESGSGATNLYKPAERIKMPEKGTLDAFRNLVVGAQRGKVQVKEATSEYIQQDFVSERQRNKAITSDGLIRRMTIAKLYALSMHLEEVTIDVWERAKAFDEKRIARLIS